MMGRIQRPRRRLAAILYFCLVVSSNGFIPGPRLEKVNNNCLRELHVQKGRRERYNRNHREGFNEESEWKRRENVDSFDEYDDDEDAWINEPIVMDQPTKNDNMGPAPADEKFFSIKSLEDPSFSRSKQLFLDLCKGTGIERPSKIQSLAWPALLNRQHAIVADQTGSGKTLAYLLPLLQGALKSKESGRTKGKQPYGQPRVIILAPTAELADQIRTVCGKISEVVPFSTMVVTATGKFSTNIRDQIRLLQRQPVDVLISTPGRLSTILRTKNAGLDLSALQSIVLDEVDVLLVDETFGPQLRTVGAAAPLDQVQFVFVTATLPDTVVESVEREFGDIQQIKGPGLHRVAQTMQERLVDVSVPSKNNRDSRLCFDIKAKELLQALRQTRCRRTLIFCNTVESCRKVENLLTRRDRQSQVFDVRAYHNAMTPEARNENLAIFAHGQRQSLRKGGQKSKQDQVDYVLVCTDRAARGVDFDAAPVDHVVLFDFPKDPAEYVRRVGRTARAGRQGTSTVFAYGWQLPIARSVMGGKLEYSVAGDLFGDDEDAAEEYRGGVKGRLRKGKRRGAKEMIKGNIEGGKLWK